MENTKKIKTKMNTRAILIVLVFSAFIGVFNETILNVALNTLMNEMNVSAGTIQWIITAYMIVVSVMVPVTAFLLQSFKTKNLYLVAMALLLIGTIGSVFSFSFSMLLISRMIQGLGAGMLIPVMMNTILLVTPPEKHGSAMGIGVCAIQLGPALGPTVSGLLLQFFNWHALFIMLIPFIIIAIIGGHLYLVNVSELTKPKLDILSIFLSTAGVGGVIYGLSTFSSGENLKITAAVFILGIVLLAVFGKRQLVLKEPMLEMRTFKYPLFSIGVALVMLSMMAIFTMNVMLPIYLQGALKATTFTAAMVLLPATLCNGLCTLVSGKIYDSIGAKILIPAGFALVSIFLFIISRADSNTSLIVILFLYAAVGIGIGCSLSPSQTNALNKLPVEYYPHGVAILNTLQQIAAAIGSAVFIGIMSASSHKALSVLGNPEAAVAVGFRTAVIALDILAFIGLGLSITLIKSKSKK